LLPSVSQTIDAVGLLQGYSASK